MTEPAFPKHYNPTICFLSEGVVCIDYGHSPVLTAAGLMEVVRRRREVSDQPMPVLVKLSGRPMIDAGLPQALRDAEYCRITTAVAYVTGSWQVRNLINTHLTVQKPPYPIFVFECEEEALTCLKRYVSQPSQNDSDD